jgi:hypothetical protein
VNFQQEVVPNIVRRSSRTRPGRPDGAHPADSVHQRNQLVEAIVRELGFNPGADDFLSRTHGHIRRAAVGAG